MVRTIFALIGVAFMAAVLAACGAGASEAAESAFNACDKPEASVRPLVLDGNTVAISITGDLAKAVAGSDGEIKDLGKGSVPDDEISGIAVTVATVLAAQCLVEETDFPGSYDQLKDGDSWEGWSYSEETGVGAEVDMTFTDET